MDQPWGHQYSGGNMVPVEPGTFADNPPAIGPSATVHCTLADLAQYVAFHIQGDRHGTPQLGQDALVNLHAALTNNSDYAHGWIAVDRPWAGGKALTHAVSNQQWYPVIWMAPAREFGVIAVCNGASGSGTNPGGGAEEGRPSSSVARVPLPSFLTVRARCWPRGDGPFSVNANVGLLHALRLEPGGGCVLFQPEVAFAPRITEHQAVAWFRLHPGAGGLLAGIGVGKGAIGTDLQLSVVALEQV